MKLSQLAIRIAAAATAFSALAYAATPAFAQIDRSQPVRILALGDSNTAGSSSDFRPESDAQWGGYRNELRRLLIQNGYQVDFVGLLNRFSGRMQDNEHEGWYGAPLEFLSSEVVPRAMDAYDPDLVLLMAGSNNFWRNPSAPVSDFIDRYEDMLEALFAADPSVDVIVSPIVYSRHPDLNPARVDAFNAGVEALVADFSSRGFAITWAPEVGGQVRLGQIETDLGDLFHPTLATYQRMGQEWFEAIDAISFGDAAPASRFQNIPLPRYTFRLQDLGGEYQEGFVQYDGVNFFIPIEGNSLWGPLQNNEFGQGYDIPVGQFGVSEVHTLMNTAWGQSGPNSYLRVEFFGSDGAYHVRDLIGDEDVRDYWNGSFTNLINGSTTTEAFRSSNSGNRLDKQRFVMPEAFRSQTLERITVTDFGRGGFQAVGIQGVSVLTDPVEACPEGAHFWLDANPFPGGADINAYIELYKEMDDDVCIITYTDSWLVCTMGGAFIPAGEKFASFPVWSYNPTEPMTVNLTAEFYNSRTGELLFTKTMPITVVPNGS